MDASDREAMEWALSDKHEETKAYFHAYVAVLEDYIARMNANNRDLDLYQGLKSEMVKKVEALFAAYLENCAKQGLPCEVGRMSAR